jgi:precorrin-2/cobalt-factor-2 C20-methyltransferase
VLPAPLDVEILRKRLEDVEAAAIIKIGRHFGKVKTLLEEMGLSDRAHYIERATMETQRILSLDEVSEDGAPYFSMILIHRRGEAWT